jgi:hypothetical protein
VAYAAEKRDAEVISLGTIGTRQSEIGQKTAAAPPSPALPPHGTPCPRTLFV